MQTRLPGDFQDFQRAFARHVRDPQHTPRPAGVSARRMAVYNELLFNNLCSFLDACFPLCRQLLGESRWRRLNRCFYRDWPLDTPWFREIPREFVRYLQEAGRLPPQPRWFAELAHYEWVELAVDTMQVAVPAHDPAGDLLARPIVLNPAHLLLAYAWPVHRIALTYRPRRPLATHLLVYRNAAEQVAFVELNPLTARLLQHLAAATGETGETVLRQLAACVQGLEPATLLAFGRPLLNDFRAQGIVLGSSFL